MKQPSSLTRYALLRRRVHQSWVITLSVALVGGSVCLVAGLMPTVGVVVVLVLLVLLRPALEVYFSSVVCCPHCETDLFLEMCTREHKGGVEEGLICPSCGKDATVIDALNGPVIDVD